MFVRASTKAGVDGKEKSMAAVRFIVARHDALEETFKQDPSQIAIWERLKVEISAKDCQFVQHRVQVKVEQFNATFHNSKQPNVLQKRLGIDDTPLVLHRILYSSLRKQRDTIMIEKELMFRDLATTGPWKEGLIKRLKDHEGDTKSFEPRHPDLEILFDMIIAGGQEEATVMG
jgi:hypothetical protein